MWHDLSVIVVMIAALCSQPLAGTAQDGVGQIRERNHACGLRITHDNPMKAINLCAEVRCCNQSGGILEG
jgi:hypothetical protein